MALTKSDTGGECAEPSDFQSATPAATPSRAAVSPDSAGFAL